MAFDRGQFRGAKLSTLKDEKKRADSKDKVLKGRSEFHSIEDGDNIFRIAPPHDPEKEPSWRPIRTTWLECNVDGYDSDGNPTGKKERKNKKVFISTIHGAGEQKERDIVETYIRFLCDQANDQIQNKEDRTKYLAPVYGYKDKKGKFVGGIMPGTNYISYAFDTNGKLGRLEVYKSVFNQIDRLNVEEDDQDGSLEIDVFANPDEGYPLKISKSKENNKTVFVVQKVLPKRRETMEEFFDRTKVTDTQLKELSEQDSLTQLYVNSYKRSDFELAIDGLRYFDEKFEYGIFKNDDFLEELENISKLYPADAPKKSTKKVVEVEEDDEEEEVVVVKKKKVVVEEEEEEKPVVKKVAPKKVVVEEEEEEPVPVKKKKVVEEEPEPVKKKKVVVEEDEQEEEKPVKKTASKVVIEEDDDDEDEPKRDAELQSQIASLKRVRN